MTDHLIAQARMRLSEATEGKSNARLQLAKFEAEERKWEQFIATYGELTGKNVHALDGNDDLQGVLLSSGPRASSESSTMLETERRVTGILEMVGLPMKTRVLLAELERQNFKVGGQDPASTLSARLSRAQSLVNSRAHGWMTRKMADGMKASEALPSADHPQSGPVEPVAGGGT